MLNEALRLIRVFHDISQKDLAARLGIGAPYLSEIEAGKKEPTLQLLRRYADGFKMPTVVDHVSFGARGGGDASERAEDQPYRARCLHS